jgi:putative transposase
LRQEYAITPSMSRRGNCWGNAGIENFFEHHKEVTLRDIRNPTLTGLKRIINDYVNFYNYVRIQFKTKQTPFELRCLPS